MRRDREHRYAIAFIGRGVPYNPLSKADPGLPLSAEERWVGDLGIYMAKKRMDGMEYDHREGKNVLSRR